MALVLQRIPRLAVRHHSRILIGVKISGRTLASTPANRDIATKCIGAEATTVGCIVKAEEFDANAPVDLPTNPYENPCRECILCRFKVKLNYKNARLLQQFVSTFSGRLYDRHITGLCKAQHDAVAHTIALSRRAGYMPIMVKDPKYLKDPKLFNPIRPRMPHSYD